MAPGSVVTVPGDVKDWVTGRLGDWVTGLLMEKDHQQNLRIFMDLSGPEIQISMDFFQELDGSKWFLMDPKGS